MAIGSGVGASWGLKSEVTWGTYVAPTLWLPLKSFKLNPKRETVPVSGVAAGRIAPPDDVETITWGEGNIAGDVLRAGFGTFLQHLCGGSATPVQQAATAAYLQTHVIGGDNRGKGLTVQEGLPDVGGTANPFTGYGGKVLNATFSCNKGEALGVTSDLWFKKVDQVQSLAAPGYTATQTHLPFNWSQMALKLGTFASEVSVTNAVKGVSVTVARGMNTDDAFYAGNAGAPSEPVFAASDIQSVMPVTGTIDVDLATKADFIDRYTGYTSTSLVWEFVGPIIASTYAYTFRISLAKVKFGGEVPGVDGGSVVSGQIPFTAFLDTTNGYGNIAYMSTDTALV